MNMFNEVKGCWALAAVGFDEALIVDCCEFFAPEIDAAGWNAEDLFTRESAPPKKPGLVVWEGDITYQEDEVYFRGSWRRANAGEIIRFSQGMTRYAAKGTRDV